MKSVLYVLVALSLFFPSRLVFGQCAEMGCNNSGNGTLFKWSFATDKDGGPDMNEPLVTDRPDFTEAASTVGKGVAQIEFGYTYTADDDGINRTIANSYGEPLLRYGILADWLEMRVGWNVVDEAVNGAKNSGTDDLYLGLKIGLTPQCGIFPEMALIPQMTVPTGSSDFTSGETLGGLNWIYAWELNERISTGGSTQFNRAVDGISGDAYTEWAQSWTVAVTLTERWGAYSEYFGLFPHSATTVGPENYFNGGFTFLFNPDVQFDIRGGVGLNDAAADYFVGSGMTIRFH